ncbi:hypothetical protein F4604DRAFT_1776969 [Suillus subluteus]|nr:hypothetical protein F4604DRAFT_1776969 [Suillus subluteus]
MVIFSSSVSSILYIIPRAPATTLCILLHPLASSETVFRPLAQSYTFLVFSRAFSYRLALSRISINFTFSLILL